MSEHLLFIGERRSPKTIRIGATWHNGRLAGRTLRDTLLALGLDPAEQGYTNLWRDDGSLRRGLLPLLQWMTVQPGWELVGLGQKVQRLLDRAGIRHRKMVHPAARGAIRGRAAYLAHARLVLLGEEAETDGTDAQAGQEPRGEPLRPRRQAAAWVSNPLRQLWRQPHL